MSSTVIFSPKSKDLLCWHNYPYISLFYHSFIESVLCFSFISWYFNLHVSVKNKNSLRRIVRLGSKIIGEPQRDLTQFCEQQVLRKAQSILTSDSHVLKQLFQFLPSGRHFGLPLCKTNRRKFPFVPVAARLLNGWRFALVLHCFRVRDVNYFEVWFATVYLFILSYLFCVS